MRTLPKLLAALPLLLIVSSCSDKQQEAAVVVPEVPVMVAAPQDLPLEAEFIGQTKGAVDADVRARVEGVIQSIHFQEGKEVKEGDLLYTIDPAPFQAKVAEAKAKLAEAETRLIKAQSDLKRIKPLAAMKAVSERDLDAAVAQEGVARGGVDAAKAGVDTAEIDLSYTKITAPVSGIIGLTKAKIGEFVGKPPNSVVLNTVSQLDPIHVAFTVTEKEYLYFARLRAKASEGGTEPAARVLHLFLADGSEHPQPGKLASVDSQIDPATGSLAAEAEFPNPGKIVRPGQFAKIRTTREVVKGALTVPRKAVRDLQGMKQILLVKPDDTVELRTVTLGEELGDVAVISQGLTAGEKVISQPQLRLSSGMKVKPMIDSSLEQKAQG